LHKPISGQDNHPVFNGTHNKWHGLQILINDTQQTEVSIQTFTPIAGAVNFYSVDLIVTIREHFDWINTMHLHIRSIHLLELVFTVGGICSLKRVTIHLKQEL